MDADQTYSLRRRLRRANEWLQRSWPQWSRSFEEFTSTQLGKFVVIGGCVLLMTTPIFWRVSVPCMPTMHAHACPCVPAMRTHA